MIISKIEPLCGPQGSIHISAVYMNEIDYMYIQNPDNCHHGLLQWTFLQTGDDSSYFQSIYLNNIKKRMDD